MPFFLKLRSYSGKSIHTFEVSSQISVDLHIYSTKKRKKSNSLQPISDVIQQPLQRGLFEDPVLLPHSLDHLGQITSVAKLLLDAHAILLHPRGEVPHDVLVRPDEHRVGMNLVQRSSLGVATAGQRFAPLHGVEAAVEAVYAAVDIAEGASAHQAQLLELALVTRHRRRSRAGGGAGDARVDRFDG